MKIAWRDLSRVEPKYRSRFFTTEALAVQADTCKTTLPNGGGRVYDCTCKPTLVGMVGSPTVPAPNPLQPPWSSTDQQDFGCEDGTPAAVGGLPFPTCQVANVTMETYHQLDSCQNCHQGAQRAGADFSWTLAQRAYTPTSMPK